MTRPLPKREYAALLHREAGDAEGRATARHALLTEAELAALPDAAWLVDGLIPHGGYTMLIGRHGSGKSFSPLTSRSPSPRASRGTATP